MDSKKEPLNLWALGEKYKKVIIIAGLAGIVLIFLSGYLKPNGDSKLEQEAKITTDQYTKQLEANLKTIVCSIEGAGEARIMVTLENGPETKYATEEKVNSQELQEKSNGSGTQTKQSGDSEIKYIIVKDSNGTERALAITEFEPTVKGVVIVCAGGDNSAVQQRVTNAVTTALNISSKKVCVTKLSG